MILCFSTSDLIQIVVGSITAIGIWVAILANRNQLEIFNKQLRLNFFADYTKRYQEIILNFPENINEAKFDLNGLHKSDKERTLRYMRAYFDLCSEEFHLKKQSHIDQEVWTIWESGIKFAVSKKAFKDSWTLINRDTIYGEDFRNWIDDEMKKSSVSDPD